MTLRLLATRPDGCRSHGDCLGPRFFNSPRPVAPAALPVKCLAYILPPQAKCYGERRMSPTGRHAEREHSRAGRLRAGPRDARPIASLFGRWWGSKPGDDERGSRARRVFSLNLQEICSELTRFAAETLGSPGFRAANLQRVCSKKPLQFRSKRPLIARAASQ